MKKVVVSIMQTITTTLPSFFITEYNAFRKMKIVSQRSFRSLRLSRFIGAAGAGALLLCPSSSNAFAGASPFSRSLDSISHPRSAMQQSTSTKLSSSTGVELPPAISVSPGESPVEEQEPVNPIDDSCTVLVVGSNRGIGIEFVKQCLQKGATVIATHRSKGMPESLSEIKNDYADKLITIQMDLEDEQSIVDAAKNLQSMETVKPLSHIIHNAGIYLSGASFDGTARGPRAAAPKVTKDVMMKTFAINSIAPLLVAQSFVPLMGKRSETLFPVLAFLSSKVGSVDDNGSGGAYAYRSSKSALNNIAKSMSVDLGDEARVVLLHPGWVRTDMTNGNGLIDADESAAGMLRAVEATDASTPFRFVDYKACQIPW